MRIITTCLFLTFFSSLSAGEIFQAQAKKEVLRLSDKLLSVCLEEADNQESVRKVREHWKNNGISIRSGQKGDEDVALIIYHTCVIQVFGELSDKRFQAHGIPLSKVDKLVHGK